MVHTGVSLTVLGTTVLGLASFVAAQTDPEVRTAARAGLEFVRVVPFDGKALPELELLGFRTSFDRLAFRGDAGQLYVGTLDGHDPATRQPKYRIDAITPDDGKTSRVEQPGAPQLVGGSPRGPLLLGNGRLTAPGEAEWQVLAVPERTDVFLSPFGSVAVVSQLDRRIRTRVVDLRSGASQTLALGQYQASAVAFHPGGRFAIARALATVGLSRTNEGTAVFGADGAAVANLPKAASEVTVLAFDASGDALYLVDDRLRRFDLASKQEVASSGDRPSFFAELDAGVAIGHDQAVVRVYVPSTLAVVKEFPLAAAVPEDAGATLQQRGSGLGAAISGDRRWLAVATYQGIHLFRVANPPR